MTANQKKIASLEETVNKQLLANMVMYNDLTEMLAMIKVLQGKLREQAI